MKKNFKKLVLNKSTLSNLESKGIIGGASGYASCYINTPCSNQIINPNPQPQTRDELCMIVTGHCTGPIGPYVSHDVTTIPSIVNP
jgi:hypothetical protein